MVETGIVQVIARANDRRRTSRCAKGKMGTRCGMVIRGSSAEVAFGIDLGSPIVAPPPPAQASSHSFLESVSEKEGVSVGQEIKA
jgi:hypothetical protein